MIYITGDTHGNFLRFGSRYFPAARIMSREDYVIVCGDFGIWDESKEHGYWLDWLDRKPFTTLFIDGNHENFDLLDRYPTTQWNGGGVHQIREHILHLMRGQVFEIDGITFFTMGGAASHDISAGILEPDDPAFRRKKRMLDKDKALYRINHVSWWREEMPDDSEYETAIRNLKNADWRVDCILTHCAPDSIASRIYPEYKPDRLTGFLEMVKNKCAFDYWFFGHYHDNRILDERFILQWEQMAQLTL
jgi:DNA repair exonuclease SbcCD nuclease subunit